ncbi:MAG: fasciclin domain-containing protein [Novosphingobium sp.]|nr:fasciclin domain-containing protein [Novosphingobium sp.]
MTFRPIALAFAAIAMVPLAACSDNADVAGAETAQSMKDALDENGDLSSFAEALEDTGLAGIFDGPSSYTVLAPVNDAFPSLPEAGEDQSEDQRKPMLAAILRDHILPGTVMPDDIKASLQTSDGPPPSMATMGNGTVTFSLDGDQIVATGASGQRAILDGTPVRTTHGVVIPISGSLRSATQES